MQNIVLLGLDGHAHVVDGIEQTGKYNIIGFLDTERMQGKCFRDYTVLGTDDALKKYYDSGIGNIIKKDVEENSLVINSIIIKNTMGNNAKVSPRCAA